MEQPAMIAPYNKGMGGVDSMDIKCGRHKRWIAIMASFHWTTFLSDDFLRSKTTDLAI
jgi:hypothetical protein